MMISPPTPHKHAHDMHMHMDMDMYMDMCMCMCMYCVSHRVLPGGGLSGTLTSLTPQLHVPEYENTLTKSGR